MDEIITIVEAEVEEVKQPLLEKKYSEQSMNLPEGITQTFLLQSQRDPQRWRIMTHWRSQQDLDQMRASTDTPVAVMVFKAVGATPQLDIWKSKVHQYSKF